MRLHAFCALLLGLAACARGGTPRPPAPAASADRVAVYTAAIEYLFVHQDTRQILIAPCTSPGILEVRALSTDTMPGVPDSHRLLKIEAARMETWRDFAAQNQQAEPVPTPLPLRVPIVVVDSPALAKPYNGGGRGVFAGFPEADVVVRLSGIGFDPAHQEALVSAFQSCGPLCGHGGLLLLRRTASGAWTVARQLTLIQS